MEGKRSILKASFFINLFGFICLFLAFASPYWFVSWPRVYSPFKMVGLWEACFAGLVLPMDPEQKAYHGCWWILASEFKDIREWLMPWWFTLTQVFVTICLLLQGINLVLQLITLGQTASENHMGTGKRRAPIRAVQTSLLLILLSAILMTFIVVLFGMQAYYDHLWMPNPELNYLSWSYGFAVVAAFMNIFSTIAQMAYTKIERQELREPPAPVMGSMIPPKHPGI